MYVRIIVGFSAFFSEFFDGIANELMNGYDLMKRIIN